MKTLQKSLQHATYCTKGAMVLTALSLFSLSASATTTFKQINLVTDAPTATLPQISDPNLKNAWGISYSPTGPFWVSDNGTGLTTLYRTNPVTQATTKVGLTVAIPGAGNVTGQVFNSNASVFNNDAFLFVSEDGTISGWRGALGTTAEVLKTGAATDNYKGAAEAAVGGNNYLYAANFGSGAIDVYKGTNTGLGASDLSGKFTDPNLPSGYSPFNIQNLNDKLYVAYALKDVNSPDEVAGPGNGLVSVFDTQGTFIERVATNGSLNAPWGLAIAPTSFGEYAGDLLVGNFGDGTINAFNPTTHQFNGQLTGSDGKPLSIDGLWALTLGNNAGSGSNQVLYFSAGPNDELNGLFGAVTAVPLPAGVWLFGSGLVALLAKGRRVS